MKQHHFILILLLFVFIFCSCSNNAKKNDKGTQGKNLSIKVEIPSKQDAIQHIKTHAARTNQMVKVSTQYYKDVKKKKPCDEIDNNLNRCSGADSFSKYGYKMVMQKERTCCRLKEKLVSKITGIWVATYIAPNDEWSVALEYKDDSKKEQKLSWSIKLSKSSGIQVSFG